MGSGESVSKVATVDERSSFPPKKFTGVVQRWETATCTPGWGWGKQPKETGFERVHMSDLVSKDFNTAITSMFKELKETMLKRRKI